MHCAFGTLLFPVAPYFLCSLILTLQPLPRFSFAGPGCLTRSGTSLCQMRAHSREDSDLSPLFSDEPIIFIQIAANMRGLYEAPPSLFRRRHSGGAASNPALSFPDFIRPLLLSKDRSVFLNIVPSLFCSRSLFLVGASRSKVAAAAVNGGL